MFKRWILLALSLALSAGTSLAASSELSGAADAARNGDCASAVPVLKPLAEKKLQTEDGAFAAEILAGCYEMSGDTANLSQLVSRYLEFYAGSPARAKMEIFAAKRALKKDSTFMDGVSALFGVISYAKDPGVKGEAEKLLLSLISSDARLDVTRLTSLSDKVLVSHRVSNAAWLRLGKLHAAKRNAKAARYWFKKVVAAGGREDWVAEAQKALGELEGKPSIPTLLVLAPLSGDFAEFGRDAVKGVRLALEQSGLKDKVNLRVADTRADAVEALRRTRQAVAQDSVVAIIGPLMSSPAAAVGAWLSSSQTKIPMLTPTATDAGISRMGANIFQVNVSMDNLASGIANYAVGCLGIREFAILSPAGDFGTAMSQSFERAVKSRGAAVVAVQGYEEGHPDYTTEFRKLRAVRFNQVLHKRNISRGAKDLDAIGNKERKAYMQDSVFRIPGIFIPSSSPSDAGLMSGQVAYNKFSGTLLGTSGWYGEDLILEGKKLVEGAFFSVPFADSDSNGSFKSFSDAYKAKWNEEPKADRVSGLSYSAANIVLSLLAAGEVELVKKIHEKKAFPGVYGEIRFERGANANMQIMSVDSGAFVNKTACPAKP